MINKLMNENLLKEIDTRFKLIDGDLYRFKKQNWQKVSFKFNEKSKGYTIGINAIGKTYYPMVSHVVFYLLTGKPVSVGIMVDHIDNNPLNNNATNLRLATSSQNSQNRSSQKGSYSKFVCVNKCKNGFKCIVSLPINNENEGVIIRNKLDEVFFPNKHEIKYTQISEELSSSLKERYEANFETGELYLKENNFKKLVKTTNNRGYLITRKLLAHRIIYFLYHGNLPLVLDHIDRNRINNKIINLRASNGLLNSRNRLNLVGITKPHKMYVKIEFSATTEELAAKQADAVKYFHSSQENKKFIKYNFPIEENEIIKELLKNDYNGDKTNG